MAKKKKQKKNTPSKQPVVSRPKEFLDLIAPAAVKFNTDHFILGGTYRSVVALRSYPPTTEELALLRRLGEMAGVTLRLSARRVTTAEEDAIIHAATNKNRMERSNFSNIKQSVTAEEKIQDVETLIKTTRRQTEPLIHCSCFLELTAPTMEELRSLRDEVNAILIRSKLGTDPLLLRQRDGFLSSNPAGQNAFGSFAERVLPASSVANLYPISYSGKTDPMGFYVGRDKYGSNVIVDLDRRADDKTNASALILGNSGQGKTYLLRLLLCNVLEAGKCAISLDSEHEMEDLCRNLGGCFLDFMDGRHRINLLEPRRWDDGSEPDGNVCSRRCGRSGGGGCHAGCGGAGRAAAGSQTQCSGANAGRLQEITTRNTIHTVLPPSFCSVQTQPGKQALHEGLCVFLPPI